MSTTETSSPQRTWRVLLVDDDEMCRSLVSQMLELKGFSVTEAADVNSALALITTQSFDALLTDLHMPQPDDGLAVVSAMRQTQPQAVTLLMSAFPAMTEAAEALQRKADKVLIKPLTISSLADTIMECLGKGPSAGIGPSEWHKATGGQGHAACVVS